MNNFIRKLKLFILFLAAIAFIGKFLPMLSYDNVTNRAKSIYINRQENVYSKLKEAADRGGSLSSNAIEIASVICGGKERARHAMPMIKTAILFSESKLNFHLFTDLDAREELQNIYSNFTDSIKSRVDFVYYDTWFPNDNKDFWENLYGRCATQRLFFPSLLKKIDSVLYFDTDLILVSKLENLWRKFDEFSEREVLAGASDCGVAHCVYFKKKPNHDVPVIWKYGMNSGMLLMRLDRLREFDFERKIFQTVTNPAYKDHIGGDQDILNALFHNQTELVHYLDCSYNYFPNIYCPNRNQCEISSGIKLIHGVTNQFLRKRSEFFSMLWQNLLDLDINRNSREVIDEIIGGLDNYNSSDACDFTKSFIFNDFRIIYF